MGGEWRNQCGADAFFHICARTGLWRHRSVRFEFLPEPVGFIAYASCWFRETTEIPWSQAISIEDHARFRDYCERDFSTCTPFEVQPAPYSPDQWQPTVELQQAAMVVAARRALGGRLNGIWSVYEPSQSQLHYMQWAATHQSL
jgi:hypothetical protein